MTMALAAPGSLWLGIVFVALFQAEALALSVYSRHLGLEAMLPLGPPITFAVLAIGLLLVREQRRRRALRHFLVQAETRALRALGPMFESLRAEIDGQLAALFAGLDRLGTNRSHTPAESMERAVHRVAELSGRLRALQEPASTSGEREAENRLVAGTPTTAPSSGWRSRPRCFCSMR